VDKTALVRSDLEIMGRIQAALTVARIHVTLVDVDYRPQLDEWQIFIATPLYDSKGPAEAVTRIIKALQNMGIYEEVPLLRISIKSPSDPVIRALEAEVKVKTEGVIDILALRESNEGPYLVIFAPFTGPGGAPPSRRFDDADQLRRFLEDEVSVSRSTVEDALIEVRHKGNASIFPVQLTRREAGKLGLA
jgi:hypothetical protein